MTTTSLDELVRLWGENVRPVLVTDPEWTRNSVLDFGLTVSETQIRFFEYLNDDGIPLSVGLFGEHPVTEDIASSLDELVRLWGARVRQVFSEPGSIVAEDILNFGQATKSQIRLFEYTAADGAVHQVGLLVDSEADVSLDVKNQTSSLDELLNICDEDGSSNTCLESVISEVVDFALTATEKEIKFFQPIGAGGTLRWQGLSGKDVRQGVVDLLGTDGHPNIQRLTWMCLANLAVTHESRVEIACWPGVLQSLQRLLEENDSADPEVVEQTARCLCHLTFASENQEKIASQLGLLAALVRLLLRATSGALLEQAAQCLTHLAELRQNQVKITSHPGALDALVRLSLLASAPENQRKPWSSCVREQAVACLNNLTVLQENQVKIVSHPGVLGALVSWLGDKETTQVQRYSIKCLNNLANHYQQNKVDIASYPGLLDALVRKLKSNHPTIHRIRIQEEAARCLLHLASEYKNLSRITFHPGVLDALVSCLGKYTKQRVQNLAVECIRDLVADFGNQRKIVTHPGALPAIVRMLVQDVNPRGQEVAAWCLNKLASMQEAKLIIASRRGVLEALISLLQVGKSSTALQPAIGCMASLALFPDKQVQIASHPGALDALARLLEQDVESSILEQTARCLSLIASAPENQGKIFSSFRVLNALKTLLERNRTTRVLEQGAKCLMNLAEFQENQVRIASFPGLLQVLVALLSQNVMPSVQEESLRCLAKLSESQDTREKITACTRDALMKLRTTNTIDSSVRMQAVRCLENLSPSSLADKYQGISIRRQPTGLRVFICTAFQDTVSLQLSLVIAEFEGRDTLHGTEITERFQCCQMKQSKQRERSSSDFDPSYLDPLTHDIMCDPVKCTDGRTYDRWTILNDPTHSIGRLEIVQDDSQLRARIFEAVPEQEAKFSDLRQKYREEALQHALIGEYEDAEEKLNGVLKWAPSDVECRRELERILNFVLQSIDPERWDMDPLTYDRMCDPVKCNDGRTYDRWTIVDKDLFRCPYDANLKPFGIVVDDLNVRRRLFEQFPEQEDKFRTRRITYREEALQHSQKGEVSEAIKKLSNVLKWAPEDRICRKEFRKNRSRLQEQKFKMPFVEHEHLVAQAKRDHINELTPLVILFFLALGVWFLIDFGWLTVQWHFSA